MFFFNVLMNLSSYIHVQKKILQRFYSVFQRKIANSEKKNAKNNLLSLRCVNFQITNAREGFYCEFLKLPAEKSHVHRITSACSYPHGNRGKSYMEI